MHIPENYLSPVTCAVMGAAMIPVWIHAVKKTNEELPKEKIPLLGAGAAFSGAGDGSDAAAAAEAPGTGSGAGAASVSAASASSAGA